MLSTHTSFKRQSSCTNTSKFLQITSPQNNNTTDIEFTEKAHTCSRICSHSHMILLRFCDEIPFDQSLSFHNILSINDSSFNLTSSSIRDELYIELSNLIGQFVSESDKQRWITNTYSLEKVIYFASKYCLIHIFELKKRKINPNIGIILLQHEKHCLPTIIIFIFTVQIFVMCMNYQTKEQLAKFDCSQIINNLLDIIDSCNGSLSDIGPLLYPEFVSIIIFYFKLTWKVVHQPNVVDRELSSALKFSIRAVQTSILMIFIHTKKRKNWRNRVVHVLK